MRALGTVVALSIRGAFEAIVIVAVVCVVGAVLVISWLANESGVDTK